MSENIPLSFSINEIKVVSSLFNNEKPASIIDDLKFTTDVEVVLDSDKSLLEVIVSFEIVEPPNAKIMAFIKVLSSFTLDDSYTSDVNLADDTNLSPKAMDHFLTIASSHARGIFSYFSKGTPYENLMVPNLQSKDLLT